VIAMDDLWLVGPVSQIDFDLKRDRLAGEALTEVGLEGRPRFFADHFRGAFADHLLGRKPAPFRLVPVDELVAGLSVAVRNGDRFIAGDKPQLALAVAQQPPCRLWAKGLSMLCHLSGLSAQERADVAGVGSRAGIASR